ncbi:uncharacterized protein LOC119668150 isoform X4 [Teleopsis dalmanni]|uniref:uncharacterized protein LOC119668150 isoform X4 n=1 Tax=Teleopsis dalmanni TaxID=139649 RepID=UPI0018CF2E7E|nr:uncharacterized protein LOC119668150 isoform X4 [Teleopsis dalmanni]
MNSRRSASVGALPHEKKHYVSRNESASGISLDVRCACQYFQCDSLLPDRVNPADSRPSSKLGFHEELGSFDEQMKQHTYDQSHKQVENWPHLQSLNSNAPLHLDQLSNKNYNIGGHAAMDLDRISTNSNMGGLHTSSPPVDSAFLQRYPELEEAARSGGLVVRSISDATDPDLPGSSTFVAGHRNRHMSVSGLSTGSFGMRDPETLSMRSGVSLRRISRSPSKPDLIVADINIPGAHLEKRATRSVSASRRSSNIDLSHFTSHKLVTNTISTLPQVNLIAPTPTPVVTDIRPDFKRALTPTRSPSPARSRSPARSPSPIQDYRIAKPPASIDYMRPDENKENSAYYLQLGEVLPQNRPIDVSKYNTQAHNISLSQEEPISNDYNFQHSHIPRAASPYPVSATVKQDPLQRTVAELEALTANTNLMDIRDDIKLNTIQPTVVSGATKNPSLHLDEDTHINIVSSIPIVDIEKLVQDENVKASAANSKTSSKQPASYQPFEQVPKNLTLPQGNITQPQNSANTQLKRQHPIDRQPSPKPIKKPTYDMQQLQPQTLEIKSIANSDQNIPDAKASYTSKIKSMFSAKNSEAPSEPSPFTQRRSPTPKREKSPSTAPSKIKSIFSKSKPTPMEIVSGSSAVITKKPEAEPMAVKVTETFSLKVDEMDQYCSRPAKQSATHFETPSRSIYSSRDEVSVSERLSIAPSEAFVPIVLPQANRESFVAGIRNSYASDMDVYGRRSESELHSSSQDQTRFSKGGLISVPINIGSNSIVTPGLPPSGLSSQHNLPRSPSEQRMPQIKLSRKTSFLEGRTQSQDRAHIRGSTDDIYTTRMTKTVSFNFEERKSRLSAFESTSLSQQQKDQRDFLERTYFSRDHEYEPIGVPVNGEKPVIKKESSPAPVQAQNKSKIKMEIDTVRDEMKAAEDLQRDFEEQYFSSATTTPRTESRTDNEIHTSQVDTSALEELPLKPENRKKGFMASAQDRTRKMQAGLKSQAGKLKTKLRSPAKKPPAGSPKAKDRKRFKAPEFSKIKMPEIKRPDMSKLKELKRPEFTKFNKPDMSKFKLPEKFSTLKLRRSKSLKENETSPEDEISGITTEAPSSKVQESQPQKKIFEFNFGTYPRAFRKKKKPVEPEPLLDAGTGTGTGTEGLSVITSTETQPSVESSSSPQGDRGPGPVRSRWADKFSDVSYNDSEGSRYRRYGSEQESFDRESSLERRMREDLEDTGSEAPMELGILGGVADNKQFAEFDEENRAIHEISNLRAGEFKRRPMVHQDSDLRSEDSKEAVGWTDKEIQKNKLLRHAELEAEASYLKYSYDDGIAQETHSTASSGKKVVMEEIDDDEFFLRKRGISQDNIELRQYITNAIREGYDTPINALQHVGQSSERMEFGEYDVPPPKPRRLHKSNRPEDISQEFETQRSDYGDDLSMSQNGSDFLTGPKRPMRKERSRSKYSMDSQDVAMPDDSIRHARYFDDDEEYLRPPRSAHYRENNFDIADKQVFTAEDNEVDSVMQQPQAPQRKRRQLRDVSMDKDSYINGFSGRSVSNNYLQEPEDVIVYRTEHEYPIPPLATPENYTDGNSIPSRKSRSTSRFDEDDRTSRGADSLTLDANMRIDNDIDAQDVDEKFIIDMIESDGYAVVRKEQLPKPTPPARRKKFSRSPGERFATMPNMRTKHGTPPPERPPPPREYTPSTDLPTKPVYTTDVAQNYEDDYEEPGISANERPESPRDLQSGDVINKMKYRPLPPPPRPPRDKRNRAESRASNQGSRTDEHESTMLDIDENIATSSTADSYDQNMESDDNSHIPEVEVSTQTDPLPDDFICEEFEITEDMKVIAPRRSGKTLDELMKEHLESETNEPKLLTEDEQLAIGLQRFRDANQRSLSERSRASSQADRSRSLSRPQTPSAVIIERRVSTPIPSQQNESVLEAALIVRPVDDLDLEEEALRREGLLTDSSQQSKSDVESHYQAEADNTEEAKGALSDYSYAPSSSDLDAAIEKLRLHEEELSETQHVEEEDAEIERTMRDYSYDDDEAERYSNHYDEDESELTTENVTAKNELLRLQELLEKTTLDALNKTEKSDISEDDNEFTAAEKELLKRIERIEQMDTESSSAVAPLPPPRRKSTTAIETTNDLIIAEQIPTQLTPVQAVVNREQLPQSQLPSRLGDLEVDHLRVHALQAGQIMVSQLHGTEISADELECKSGSLVVKNIELPPGFIEDIVERVRNTERSQLLNTETQTSLQASNEEIPTEQVSQLPVSEIVPPPKPPRLRNLESTPASTTYTADIQHDITQQNLDEETQTDIPAAPQLPPIVFPTAEYLQSIAPLALYNLRQQTEMDPIDDTTASTKCQHRSRHHHHHHHRRRDSTSSDIEEEPSDIDEPQIQRRHRSRSTTRPRDRQSIAAATKQLLGACSLQVVNIVNHLTEIVRGEGGKEQDIITRLRQVPVLVALFIVVTFGVLLYLLSGKNVHTHHWDYFNPPGNDGRHQT